MLRPVLTRAQITRKIRQILDLPDGTWQLALNGTLTCASYMDGQHHVHHLDIDAQKREALTQAIILLNE